MKCIHLSDLHLGKRVNEYSMIEDQAYILAQICACIEQEKPDCVLIAGDVYDKSVPPAEAVQLFDDFLVRLSTQVKKVFVIGGNHDSHERIAFGARLMYPSGVHMAPLYNGTVLPISMPDSFGTVDFFLLPFLKPAHVKRFFLDCEIESYTAAVKTAIDAMQIDPAHRSILITHQFITGGSRSESEEVSVGGSDNVDVSVFAPFDYVALGHLHNPQDIVGKKVRYCGTPLKYSFSEANQSKSITVVELGEKGNVALRMVPLVPKRDLREIKGSYQQITLKSFYQNTTFQDDYLHITLTDEDDIPDGISKLRVIYPNIMKLDYDNRRTRTNNEITGAIHLGKKAPFELFAEFFEKQNNQPVSLTQRAYVEKMIESIWEAKE